MKDVTFWSALVVGIFLTIAGAMAQSMGLLGVTTAQLILCSGLGIVLGAFGAQATVNYKGFVVTGVAAIAIALLVFVDYLVRRDFVFVQIDGDVRGATVVLRGERDYHGAWNSADTYEFVVTGSGIAQKRLKLTINLPDDKNTTGRELIFGCVPKSEIEPFLGSHTKIQWRFDKDAESLIGDNGRVIAQIGPCRHPPIRTYRLPAIIASAFAEGALDWPSLLDGLESHSTVVRRESREKLALIGLDAVRPMLDRMAQTPESYRTRLGVIVALTEMLRESKTSRGVVISLLNQRDIEALVAAAVDEDRTIRVYASEFLFDLGDPRVVPAAFGIITSVSENAQYNLVFSLLGALPYLSAETRSNVIRQLYAMSDSFGPKTRNLIARAAKL